MGSVRQLGTRVVFNRVRAVNAATFNSPDSIEVRRTLDGTVIDAIIFTKSFAYQIGISWAGDGGTVKSVYQNVLILGGDCRTVQTSFPGGRKD